MTETATRSLPAVRSVPLVGDEPAMRDWADELVARARDEGVELTGDNGLLTALVRQVLQAGLEVEMTDHLGYERHAVEGRGSGNSRNGTTPKTVTTEIGSRRAARPVGPQRELRPEDRAQREAPARWPVGQHHLALRERDDDRRHPVTRRCSSTRSSSRCATVKSPTGRSTQRSASTSTVIPAADLRDPVVRSSRDSATVGSHFRGRDFTVERPGQRHRHTSIGAIDRVRVRPQRHRRVGVTETTGNSADVVPTPDRFRGRPVPQVVQPPLRVQAAIAATE